MAGVLSIRQASFGGGEISPSLWARTDLARYAIALRLSLNWFVGQHGVLHNRSGTKFVHDVKNSTDPAPRLIRFVFSSTEAYVLEFGHLYMRVYQNGAIVANGSGVPYEIATPYTISDVRRLKYAQIGNTMTIVHPSYAPRELVRIANNNWTLTTIDFTVQVWTGPTGLGFSTNEPPVNVPDATHPAKKWQWQATLTYQDPNGVVKETAPIDLVPQTWSIVATYPAGAIVRYTNGLDYTSLQAGNNGKQPDIQPAWWVQGVVLFTDKVLKIVGITGSFVSGTVLAVNLYRGRDGIFGFIGSSKPISSGGGEILTPPYFVFTDDGLVPDYSQGPRQGTNPFAIPGGGFQYPGAVAFFEQRRVFARTNLNPQTLWFSGIGAYTNFDNDFILTDASSFEVTVSSVEYDEVRSLVPLRALIVLAQGGEYALGGGGQGVPVTPSTVDVHSHSRRGSAYLDPIVIGSDIIHAQEKGNTVRDFVFDIMQQTYTGNELSLIAEHLFPSTTDLGSVDILVNHIVHSGGKSVSTGLVDWAFAQVPYSIAWMVRADGVLLGLTYNKEQEIVAWHRHTTNGTFESVCSIPEGGEDAVYFVVKRGSRRIVERLSARQPQTTDQRLACFLDCAESFDSRNSTATTVSINSYEIHADGVYLNLVASASIWNSGMVASATRMVLFPDTTPIKVTVTTYTNATHVQVRADIPEADFLALGVIGVSSFNWSFPVSLFTLESALYGYSVMALVDGVVSGPYVVNVSNQVTIDEPGVIVTIGLAYTSDFDMLDVVVPGQEAHMQVKSIPRAMIEVSNTRGLQAGRNAFDLHDVQLRGVEDSYGAIQPYTGRIEVGIMQAFEKGGRLFVRQSDPLPATILAVTREVALGGH